jgi:hypothetical protein
VQLLKTMLLWKLGRWDEALHIIRRLAPVLRPGRKMEHDYLRAYLSFVANAVTSGMPVKSIDTELKALLLFNPAHIRFDQVPRHVRRKFPMPDRSRWPQAWRVTADLTDGRLR